MRSKAKQDVCKKSPNSVFSYFEDLPNNHHITIVPCLHRKTTKNHEAADFYNLEIDKRSMAVVNKSCIQ